MCESIDFMEKEIVYNTTRLGLRGNPFNLLNHAFKTSDFNVYLEEDVVVSPDILHLANWYFEQGLWKEYMMLCLSNYNTRDYAEDTDCLLHMGEEAFTPFSWAITKENWIAGPSQWWGAHKHGWDHGVGNGLRESNNRLLFPYCSRCNHIGEVGWHMTPEYHAKGWGEKSYYQGDPVTQFKYKAHGGYSKKLSVVIPFYHKMDEFRIVFPMNEPYLRGRQVVLCLDDSDSANEVVEFAKQYKRVGWKVLVNRTEHPWRTPAKAINVGLRHADGDYVLIISPESRFVGDLPLMLLKDTNETTACVGALNDVPYEEWTNDKKTIAEFRSKKGIHFYGSICFSKERGRHIGGFDECMCKWGGEDDNFRSRLKLAGVNIKECPDANIIHMVVANKYVKNSAEINTDLQRVYSPPSVRCPDCYDKWGTDFSEVLYQT